MTALWALPAVASALLAIGDPLVVIDLNPGPGGSEPGPLVPLGNGVVFSAYVRGVGREIFVSDGTAAGTRLIADLVPGPAGSDPLQLTALGNEVYFLARDERGHYGRLYATDGTGVRLVRALALGFLSAVDNPMVGGRLLFVAEDGIVSLDPVTGLEELLSRRGGAIRSSGAGRALASGYWNGGLLATNGTAKGTLEIEGLLPGGITVPYLGKIAILTRPVNVEDYDDYRNFRILVTDGTDSGTRFLPFDGARIVGAAGRNLVLASM